MDLTNALFHMLSRATTGAAGGEAETEKARPAAFPRAEESAVTPAEVERPPVRPTPPSRPALPARASASRPDRPERPWDRKPRPEDRDSRPPQDRPRPERPDRAPLRPEQRPPARPVPAARREPAAPERPASRRTPENMLRVWLGVGKLDGISPGDVKGCILGETGAPTEAVGYIDLRDKHSFVDIQSDLVSAILPKLNRAHLGGRKLKAKIA